MKSQPIALEVVAIAAALLVSSHVADAANSSNETAYNAAIKCFVTDGYVAGRKERAGDRAQQAVYEKNARTAFDVASALGGKLGYSGSRINQDFGLAQTSELPKLASDSDHVEHMTSTCSALGL
jgi:hypothetical protein